MERRGLQAGAAGAENGSGLTMETRRLYRPVGLKEMQLIIDMDYHGFPPRLDWQPIFYPVLNEEYAIQIARDWNTADPASDYVGVVTAFDVDAAYLAQFEEHTVGGKQHKELWIPGSELETFNRHIVGPIRVVGVFYGEHYEGPRDFQVNP